MEKHAFVKPENKWLWHATDEEGYAFDRACCEANYWTCGIYARTWARLKAAARGEDDSKIVESCCVNPHCLSFAVCFPFYGGLIAILQQRVRSHYGIHGNPLMDCYDGCCCPCLTIVRNEQEIILREKLDKAPSPMICCIGKPSDSTEPSTKKTSPIKKSPKKTKESPTKPAESITESTKLSNLHSLDDHPTVGRATPTGHRLEDDPTASVKGKFREHLLALDPGYSTPTSEVSHSLDNDPATMRRVGSAKHSLKEDPSGPAGQGSDPHYLHIDATVTIKDDAKLKHGLESHEPLSTAAQTTLHSLEDGDATAPTGENNAGKHSIDKDGANAV
ncbi:hypothetical protein PT974_07516 [Cladobotryum mycophilum]|uniref:Uncharacterized protein n=1 Tax=Cladobotryum mycophilum TaxID=491253 RepID=A0ABR0SPH4_9HYPO